MELIYDSIKAQATKTKLLVVDDNLDIYSVIESALGANLFEFHFSGTALDAFKILNKQNFDLVICDIKMPGQDGISLFEQIKEGGGPCPVFLFISGEVSQCNFDRLERLNQYFILNKPFRLKQLRDLVASILNNIESSIAYART